MPSIEISTVVYFTHMERFAPAWQWIDGILACIYVSTMYAIIIIIIETVFGWMMCCSAPNWNPNIHINNNQMLCTHIEMRSEIKIKLIKIMK